MEPDTPASKNCVEDFQAPYGTDRVGGDPAESAYNMFTLEECRRKSRQPTTISQGPQTMIGITFRCSQGVK